MSFLRTQLSFTTKTKDSHLYQKHKVFQIYNPFVHQHNTFSTETLPEAPSPPTNNRPTNLFEAFSKGINKYRNAKIQVPEKEPEEPRHENQFSVMNLSSSKIAQIAKKTIQTLPDLPYGHFVNQKMNALKTKENALILKLTTAKRRPNEFHIAVSVYEEIKSSEFASPNLFSLLIETFASHSKWDYTINAVSQMFACNSPITIAIYNALIAGYLRNNCPEAAYRLLQEIQGTEIVEDTTTCNLLIDHHVKAGEFDKVREILSMMLQKNISPNYQTYIHIVVSYTKFPQLNNLKKTFQIIRKYTSPHVILLNQMIQSCARFGEQSEAEIILEDMKKYRRQIDSITYVNLIELYTSCNNIEKSEFYYNDLRLYYSPEPVVFNWMIEMYARTGEWARVEKIFEDARSVLKRDDITIFNTYLCYAVLFGSPDIINQSIELIQSRGLKFDPITYGILEIANLQISSSPRTSSSPSERFEQPIKAFDSLLSKINQYSKPSSSPPQTNSFAKSPIPNNFLNNDNNNFGEKNGFKNPSRGSFKPFNNNNNNNKFGNNNYRNKPENNNANSQNNLNNNNNRGSNNNNNNNNNNSSFQFFNRNRNNQKTDYVNQNQNRTHQSQTHAQ